MFSGFHSNKLFVLLLSSLFPDIFLLYFVFLFINNRKGIFRQQSNHLRFIIDLFVYERILAISNKSDSISIPRCDKRASHWIVLVVFLFVSNVIHSIVYRNDNEWWALLHSNQKQIYCPLAGRSLDCHGWKCYFIK